MIENTTDNALKILTQGVYIGWFITFVCKMFNYVIGFIIKLFKQG